MKNESTLSIEIDKDRHEIKIIDTYNIYSWNRSGFQRFINLCLNKLSEFDKFEQAKYKKKGVQHVTQ